MSLEKWMIPAKSGRKESLLRLNEKTGCRGLFLTAKDCDMLLENRQTALSEHRRIEFGAGILPLLIETFYDAPDLQPERYAETLAVLQDLFYQAKTETNDMRSDAELLYEMRRLWDTRAHGSCHLLADLMDDACRALRGGIKYCSDNNDVNPEVCAEDE